MSLGTFNGPIQPLYAQLPGFEERPGALPKFGVQQVVPVQLVNKTAVGTTYKVGAWIAPSDGWYVEDAYFAAVVVPVYATSTLAIDNYDKSATTARNLLSTTNQNILAAGGPVLKQGLQLTLSTTLANRLLDKGDVINATVVAGSTSGSDTDGEGLVLVLVLRGPDSVPQ